MTYDEFFEDVAEQCRLERSRLRDGWDKAEAIRVELQKMDERIAALLDRTNTQSI